MDAPSALFGMREDAARQRLREVLLQLAKAQEQLGNESAAFAALEEALELVGTGGHAPSFLEQPDGLRDLIARWLDRRAGTAHPAAKFETRLQTFPNVSTNRGAPTGPGSAISRREHQILSLLNLGLSNAELAKHCCISEGTVKWYLHNLYAKLGVGNRTSLLHAVREQGLALH